METNPDYSNCIEACLNCFIACNHCATACTREPHIAHMAECIRLDMQCAAICSSTATLLSLHSEKANGLCLICADMCEDCAEECEKHHSDHCTQCAEACRICAEACRKMAA